MAIYQLGVVQTKVLLNAHDCPSCGIIFGISEELEASRRRDGKTWYCPNGHRIVFLGGEVERLKKHNAELYSEVITLRAKKAEIERDKAQIENDLLDKVKEIKRITKRAEKGVCLYCHRSFASVNMARHVRTKHQEESRP